MISVKCQRSDQDSVVILSQNKPTREGLERALKSYQWWEEKWSKVYPSGAIEMRMWIDYQGVHLDVDRAREALREDFGWWAHISAILEEVRSGEQEA
jgi:hypothetical protein